MNWTENDYKEMEKYEEETTKRIRESNNIVAEVGDVVIVCDNLPFRIVKIGMEGQDEFPYGLLCMQTHDVELWSKELHYKIGDEVFGEDMKITSIIKKKTYQMLKNL